VGAEATEADPQDAAEKAPRLPKRQSALLIGFCGTGCAGMQMWVSDYRASKKHPYSDNALQPTRRADD
jgi:hypothetical protein